MHLNGIPFHCRDNSLNIRLSAISCKNNIIKSFVLEVIVQKPRNSVELTQRFQDIRMVMKVFQSVEANYKRMGFTPNQAVPKRPLNLTILISFVVLGYASISECILLLQATTFELYVESIYVTSATIMFVTIYSASVIRIPYLYRFINTYQRVIDASKSEYTLNLSIDTRVVSSCLKSILRNEISEAEIGLRENPPACRKMDNDCRFVRS